LLVCFVAVVEVISSLISPFCPYYGNEDKTTELDFVMPIILSGSSWVNP